MHCLQPLSAFALFYVIDIYTPNEPIPKWVGPVLSSGHVQVSEWGFIIYPPYCDHGKVPGHGDCNTEFSKCRVNLINHDENMVLSKHRIMFKL